MPKKVKYWPNERVDLPDLLRSSSEYTEESLGAHVERSILDRRARMFDGFRVAVDVATAEVTIYNGNAWDRNGRLLNGEDQVVDSKTVTLSGSNTTFYIEIELAETESDVDARAFWDPTFDNGVDPDGKEFTLNTSTRTSIDWTIVTPPSTVGFDVDTNPSSTKIPVAVFRTDGSNNIDAAWSTASFTQVFPSTVLEEDTDIATDNTTIRVVDSRLIVIGDTVTIEFGGTTPETARTVVSNDPTHGILTVSPALVSDHLAGAVVRVTSGTGVLVKEGSVADQSPRMFQGDELRGSALVSSKETAGDRDDYNIRSLKDYVDMVAGQLREVKWGSPRPGVTSPGAPVSFASDAHYYDPSGGLAGARTATFTIGDGTGSWGDFNGTDQQPFIDALAALPASGGTIYVKKGTYTFTGTVTVSKPAVFTGEGPTAVSLVASSSGVPFFSIGYTGTFGGLERMSFTSAGVIVASGSIDNLRIFDCKFTDTAVSSIEIADAVTLTKPVIERCTFSGAITSYTTPVIDAHDSNINTGRVSSCSFSNTIGGTTSSFIGKFISATGLLTGFVVEGCYVLPGSVYTDFVSVDGTAFGIFAGVRVSNCYIRNCRSALSAINGAYLEDAVLSSSRVVSVSPSTNDVYGAFLEYGTGVCHIMNNAFDLQGAGAGTRCGVYIGASSSLDSVIITNNTFVVGTITFSGTNPNAAVASDPSCTINQLLISGNTVNSVVSSAACYGFLVQGSVVGTVSNNTFATGAVKSSASTIGIYNNSALPVTVTNNVVSAQSTTSSSVTGIKTAPNSAVLSNLVYDTSAGAGAVVAGIEVAGANVLVESNVVNAVAPYGIWVRYKSNVAVVGNQVICSGSTDAGILLSDTASAFVKNLRISGNQVSNLSKASSGSSGIWIIGPASHGFTDIAVRDNLVEETVFDATHSGIQLSGGSDCRNVNIVGNSVRGNVLGSSARGAGVTAAGIGIADCNNVVVSSNTVEWASSSIAGIGIYLDTVDMFSVTNNFTKKGSSYAMALTTVTNGMFGGNSGGTAQCVNPTWAGVQLIASVGDVWDEPAGNDVLNMGNFLG